VVFSTTFLLSYLKFLNLSIPNFFSISLYFQIKEWFSNFLKVAACISLSLSSLSSLHNEIEEKFEIKKFKKLRKLLNIPLSEFLSFIKYDAVFMLELINIPG
jgi:hypothetical protein